MSRIEWTGRTWNPIVGCSIVSPGCTNCYAMRMAARIERMNPGLAHYAGLTQPSKAGPVWTGKVAMASEVTLFAPIRRKTPTTYFVNSMSDLFHEDVPDEWIDLIFAVMALCPRHTFQVLTKRPERMRAYFARLTSPDFEPDDPEEVCPLEMAASEWAILVQMSGISSKIAPITFSRPILPLKNVWLGASCEDQRRADERIPDLLATPAAVRFISAEPMLGPIAFSAQALDHRPMPETWETTGIGWIIAGGESGHGARPMHPDWARSIRDQCATAGVPFFFKQWGAHAPASVVLPGGSSRHRCRRHAADVMLPTTKGKAGRLLDGREWNEMPHAQV